jgi:hypothetical protein
MLTAAVVQELNRDLARKINEEARGNRHSPYAGKFVGIANGQVVAVADDLDGLVRLLRQTEADPTRTFCLEAGLDYDDVQDIWGPQGERRAQQDVVPRDGHRARRPPCGYPSGDRTPSRRAGDCRIFSRTSLSS